MPRVANLFFAGVVCLTASMFLVAVWQSGTRANLQNTRDDRAQVAQQSGVGLQPAKDADRKPEADATKYPVIIRKPSGPPRIELGGTDPQGRTGSVACSTCHSVRKPNLENKTAATLDEFHQGMTFNHGTIACYACHNPGDSDALRLADGSTVTYENVMTLCSQCHSKQAESFAHGAHGGMNGHWDLSRGPQMKNNCIDCHDPHAPSYPKMIVGFKPKDRFNEPSIDDHDHEGAASHDEH
ncbi:Doubled CXXCH motif [Planctomycetes bacterium CA13]|uniref:Doubled CXXCH motif n=1 Tax=Novipirellula herctigrandis TaxID=2527986 RepID=A0A5C5ZDP1_9BACT|nr:Doubled CXXCH motif [Planctomycetes bacterium CA13]